MNHLLRAEAQLTTPMHANHVNTVNVNILKSMAVATRIAILGDTSWTKPERKFRRWAEKLSEALEEDRVEQLPDGCRWLSYWLRKTRDQDLYLYTTLEGEAKQLFEGSALRLWKEATLKLEEASRHREGSKARLRELAGFAYHYSNYVHPLLRESGRDSLAAETLRSFNSSYLGEIVMGGEALEGDWPVFMIRFLECYEEMGLPLEGAFKEYFVEILRSRRAPPELAPYHRMLDEAERSTQSRMVGGLLVCSALRMWVRDLCTFYGAESRRSFIGPRGGFGSWSFSKMLGYLKSVGRVSVEDVILFAAINKDLFDIVGREGYREPSQKELEDDILEARRFIGFREGENPLSYAEIDEEDEQ